jgi:hypothetical protein
MLAFYMDHQFRAAVTRGLRSRKINVLTAYQDGFDRHPDDLLLSRAAELGHVLVTHDKGFLHIAAEWLASGREFSGIAFAVQKSIDVGKTIEYLELMAHVMSPDEMRNHVEYIPVRV